METPAHAAPALPKSLVQIFEAHTALRGPENALAREHLLFQIRRHIDPAETTLAYADRLLTHPLGTPVDALVATDSQLMRLIMIERKPDEGLEGMRPTFHRLHVPRRFLHDVDLEIFFSIDETVGRWDLAPAVPHVHIHLPAALRLYTEEQWWNWEPPDRKERIQRGTQLLKRAPMWREAYAVYHSGDGERS